MAASDASDAYAKWLQDFTATGQEPWLLTFMFCQLPGSPAAIIQQMLRCVQAAYGIRITRVIKHPLALGNKNKRPIWLAAPDLPIFKHLKQTYESISANDGLHVHVIALETIFRECFECLAEDVWARQDVYRQRCAGLERIDVRAITHDIPRITSYVLKQIELRINEDNVLILPRANDEIRAKRTRVGRNPSIFGL